MLFLCFSGLFFFSPPTPSSMLCGVDVGKLHAELFCNSHTPITPHPRKASFLETSATMSRRSRARLRKKNLPRLRVASWTWAIHKKSDPLRQQIAKIMKIRCCAPQNTHHFPALRAAKTPDFFPGAARRKNTTFFLALRSASSGTMR